MKISRRRYEKKITAVRWKALGDGQEKGRQEIADSICRCLGLQRELFAVNDPIRHNAILLAQSITEALRLFAYAYDETSVEEARAFQERFYRSRYQQHTVTPMVGGAND